ncbi:3-dehydroquinate synthase [Immundisolibacter sp.]|uniref:3-dehydroquinate synthase n=1 Tax=Immundisolibacter sp. TaxID=1934948 RepID=UPI003F82C215
MKTLQLDLGDRGYPIYIGSDLLDCGALYAKHVRGRQVVLVSDSTVSALYGRRVAGALSDFQPVSITFAAGESSKTLDTYARLADELIDRRCDRGVTLVALGGGVVGDITGFLAATYHRGVDFIQVPTSLLAQVDSSVGGKTGVNRPGGKNLLGAFYQPRCVLADTGALRTLPRRELVAGVAEVIKYGLIADVEFLSWVEQHIDALLAGDDSALQHAVYHSCRIKADVVAADEREAGRRALLNLGHTFGHAIEAATGYSEWLHGEAVGLGMVMAAQLSCRMGKLDGDSVHRIVSLIERAGLPVRLPASIGTADLLRLMAGDKKVLDGRQRLVVLDAVGQGVVVEGVSQGLLSEVIDGCREGN